MEEKDFSEELIRNTDIQSIDPNDGIREDDIQNLLLKREYLLL